jgi:hypothetical protein
MPELNIFRAGKAPAKQQTMERNTVFKEKDFMGAERPALRSHAERGNGKIGRLESIHNKIKFIRSISLKIAASFFASALYPVFAFASEARDKVNNMSILQKAQLAAKAGGDGEEMLASLTGIAILFGVIIFSFIFLRRWKIPRMGYFLVTLVILVSRIIVPKDLFWITGAVTAALFSLVMFVLAHKRLDFDSRKEPLYFLFNAFTLFIISFSKDSFTFSIAGFSLLASLFFIVTLKPVPHGKYQQHDADPKIMETLQKKAQRRL